MREALTDVAEGASALLAAHKVTGSLPSERVLLQVLNHIKITTEAALHEDAVRPQKPRKRQARK